METLRVGRGYTAEWVVTFRDEHGAPVINAYSGDEPLSLVIAGLDGTVDVLGASAVAWLDPASGTVTLKLDDSDTAFMAAGPRGLTIAITVGGETLEAYRATLRVEPRAS